MAPNRAPNPEIDNDRRSILKGVIAVGLAYAADRATGGHGLRALEHAVGIGDDHETSAPVESHDKTLSLENIADIRSRAKELSKHTEESLADYILGAKHISFDESTPRVKESMVWAKEDGVFPLVQPVGDIKKGLDDVSPNVPVQKPLLVLLALLNDAAIDIRITSLSTSPDHVESSAHYEGRGCDISSTANNLAVMQFVRKMHDEGIVPMDELSAPHNPGKLGLNGGKPGDISEGDHMHFGTKELDKVKERFVSPRESSVFVDDDATDVAKKLGVKPGTYFNVDVDTAKALREAGGFSGRKDEEAAIADGIFPPSVMRWKEQIFSAAKKTGVSPNFIATIMTIESCGNDQAASAANAHGLIQVVPTYHRERIDRVSGKDFKPGAAGDPARAKYLKDHPGKSVEIGADFLSELLDGARKARPDLDPEDPVVYMRAAAGYNGGPKNVAAKFAQWPLESQLYANFVSAFYVDASVSNALKQKGLNPDEISNAMKSPAMTMRMKAFREIPKGGDYAGYSHAYRTLEGPIPGVDKKGIITDMRVRTLVQLMAAGYINDRTNKVAMVKPGLPPALTYWVAHGGGTSLEAAPGNRAWEDKLAQN